MALREALRTPSILQSDTQQPSISRLIDDLQAPAAPPDLASLQRRPIASGARVFLVSGGGKSQTPHYDIVDFVPGVLCQKESLVLSGSEGKITFDGGPKKPRLESLTPHQFYAANSRIMYKLIETGALTDRGVVDYLGYTVKIAQLADRYVWSSVLHYDRQYRELQAELNFDWGSDCTHLHQVVLREKAQALTSGKRPSTKAPIPIDPASNVEICLNFNRNICKLGGACKYAHVWPEA